MPIEPLEAAFAAAEGCDVMVVVGTSGIVQPAASIPIMAKQNGAYLVEVNLEPTPFTPMADCSVLGKAGSLLPELWDLIKNQ